MSAGTPMPPSAWRRRDARSVRIRQRLDGWGVEGVIERAPSLPALDFPPIDESIVAAIASWGGCALPLSEELTTSAEERWTVVLYRTSIALVSGYLRYGYLAEGGTDAELKAYLASDAMNALSAPVGRDPALRADINARCGPSLMALLED